jgi:hypothetical protein
MLITLEDANTICRSLRCLNSYIVSHNLTDDLIVNKDIVAIWFKFKHYSLFYDNSELCIYKRREDNSIYSRKIYISKKFRRFTDNDFILGYRMVIDGEDKEYILDYDDNFIYNFIKIICEPNDYDFDNDESNSSELLEETFLGVTHNILLKITRCFTTIHKMIELVNKINELSKEKVDNAVTITNEFIHDLRYIYDHVFSVDSKLFNVKSIWDKHCYKVYDVIDTGLRYYGFKLCNRIDNLYNVYNPMRNDLVLILNFQFYQKTSLYIGHNYPRTLEYDTRVSVYENSICLGDAFIDYLDIDLPLSVLDLIRKTFNLDGNNQDEKLKETHDYYIRNDSMSDSVWKPLVNVRKFLLKYDKSTKKRKDDNNE